jgi:hypothetical protein
MPLSINDVDTLFGSTGRSGGFGTTDAVGHGGAGRTGLPGGPAILSRRSQSFLGDAGQDIVTYSFTSEGGTGGAGGGGSDADGANSVSYSSQFGPNYEDHFTNHAPGRSGGNPGRGGMGGTGVVLFDALQFDLASVPGGQDQLSFFAHAHGGGTASPGLPGRGTTGGSNSIITTQFGTAGQLYTRTDQTTGGPGGLSGQPTIASAGPVGRVAFDDLTVLGGDLVLRLQASAEGGMGGYAGFARPHASGATAAHAWNGATGGTAGLGHARIADLTVSATDQLDLSLRLAAQGGQGGSGGNGGDAASGFVGNSFRSYPLGYGGPSSGSATNTTSYAEAGQGGNGGTGGRAIASVTNAQITGSANADIVTIDLNATGGFGGSPGLGGTGAADSLRVLNPAGPFTETYIVRGTPDGSEGRPGRAGDSIVRLLDSRIELGDSTDRLNLHFTADGLGRREIVVARNHFDGGAGTDTIAVGTPFPRASRTCSSTLARAGCLSTAAEATP